MKRRHFLKSASYTTAAASLGAAGLASAKDIFDKDTLDKIRKALEAAAEATKTPEPKPAPAPGGKHAFKLNYAPHFGMFKASAPGGLTDELKFAHDRGFTAWEDNKYLSRPPEEQKAIAKTMEQLGMEMGVFVLTGDAGATEPTFTVKNEEVWKSVLNEIKTGVEVAKRCRATWMTVVPGAYDLKLHWDYQTANCVELLKRCAAVLEPHGLVMVLEPLNHHANHPTMFLHESPQSYQICRAVGSPACKTLFDIYHQQITEGNLIPNIEMGWDEIGYFQAGDNPGRKEPGTGEINYRGVFKFIHDKAKATGRDFIIGMEHGNSIKGVEGEEAVISAYAEADDFSG